MKIFITAVLLTACNLLYAQDILDQYIETAAKNNPALKAKFNQYMATLEKIPQVGTLPDPQIMFGYFIMPIETKNGPQQAKISFTQMFPWFGTLKNKEEIFVNVAKAKYEDFEDAKSNLFFEVRSTYYDLYFIKKSIDIILENIRILETFKNLALIKIEAGKASGVDELRVEMKLADMENNLALIKDKFSVNINKFNNLLNTNNTMFIEIPNTLWTNDLPYTKQSVLDSLKENNHQLQSLDFLYQSYISKEHLTKKEGLPKIMLGADYSAIGNNNVSPESGKDAFLFKIGISIPLYRKKYSAMVKETILHQQGIKDKKVDKINTLETLFKNTYSEYTDANRRINLFIEQSELAAKALRILESEYASYSNNFEEILRMDNNLRQYSLELEKARADKQASIAFINYLMGQ